jgi:hypothetical protein
MKPTGRAPWCLTGIILVALPALRSYPYRVHRGSVKTVGASKTPVVIANAEHRKGVSRKLGPEKIAAFLPRVTTNRGDRRRVCSPDLFGSGFSSKFFDLQSPIYRAPLYRKGLEGFTLKIVTPVCGSFTVCACSC